MYRNIDLSRSKLYRQRAGVDQVLNPFENKISQSSKIPRAVGVTRKVLVQKQDEPFERSSLRESLLSRKSQDHNFVGNYSYNGKVPSVRHQNIELNKALITSTPVPADRVTQNAATTSVHSKTSSEIDPFTLPKSTRSRRKPTISCLTNHSIKSIKTRTVVIQN